MATEKEFGRCDYCGKNDYLQRKYFHYPIICECHSPKHFEIRRYCKNCFPTEPETTTVTFLTKQLTHYLSIESSQSRKITEKFKIIEVLNKYLTSKLIGGNILDVLFSNIADEIISIEQSSRPRYTAEEYYDSIQRDNQSILPYVGVTRKLIIDMIQNYASLFTSDEWLREELIKFNFRNRQDRDHFIMEVDKYLESRRR